MAAVPASPGLQVQGAQVTSAKNIDRSESPLRKLATDSRPAAEPAADAMSSSDSSDDSSGSDKEVAVKEEEYDNQTGWESKHYSSEEEDEEEDAELLAAREPAPPPARPPASSSSEHILSVFVGNLPFSATERALREKFGDDDLDIEVKRDDASGKSRGFAVAAFETHDAAAAFVEEHAGAEIDGRPLVVRLERKGTKKSPHARAERPRKRAAAGDDAAPPKAKKARSKNMSDARRAKKAARAERIKAAAAAAA